MSIFVLSKGIAAISTIGGALLGGYFATTQLREEEKEKTIVLEKEDPSKPEIEKIPEEPRGSPELQGNPISGTESDVGVNQGRREDEVDQKKVNDQHDTKDEGSSNDLERNLTGQDVELTDSRLLKELEGTTNFETSSGKEDLEESDEVNEESEEEFDEFEDDYEVSGEDDEEEMSRELKIVDYIKTGNENRDWTEQGPICEKWIRSGENNHSISREKNIGECNNLINQKIPKQEEQLLLSWLDVDRVKAKKVLEHYGLWKTGIRFKDEKRKNWQINNWSCSRKSFGNHRFIITCDYYPETK
ncbi:hypothetical protein [Mycoplasma suis]|uniref:Uncharacterized protein n=1 Tax=Mycoplasma suis (strain Illinois) TaxID=768700 RepID=F0QQM3_MYCSL|nr:hypothetical protein [Mycoplasma suis]ADX97793.1 hypothetical protein MSU_0249 [Mycoplasma suis str. Illinois]